MPPHALPSAAPAPLAERGQEGPMIRVTPPGPLSLGASARLETAESPAFGARRRSRAEVAGAEMAPIVYASGHGSNVVDVDGNRYVDLAAGFGALLLGHAPPKVARALAAQADRLWMALGDLYPSYVKVALVEKLAALYPQKGARVLLGHREATPSPRPSRPPSLQRVSPASSPSRAPTTGSATARSRPVA